MVTWFISAAPEVQAAIIGAVATFLAAAIGFTAVVLQIGRQAKAALKQNVDLEGLRIRARVYDELGSAAWSTVVTSTEVIRFTTRFKNELWTQEVIAAATPRSRLADFSRAYFAFSDAHLHLLRTIERWRVVDLRLYVFLEALNVVAHDYRNAFTSYYDLALRIMPVDIYQADGTPRLQWTPPTPAQKTALEQLQAKLDHAAFNYSMVTHDLEVELQNELVGNVFERGRVPLRKPLDPNAKVVTLANHEELSRHFTSTATGWGREKAAAEQQARAEGDG